MTCSCDNIDMSKLKEVFNTKFSVSACNSDTITNVERVVKIKFDNHQNTTSNDKFMSVIMVTIYIKKLNSGSSPGIDGIRAKHLKHALGSRIIRRTSVTFSLCLK